MPKNRTQELCKHSINFCGKLVFIAINLHSLFSEHCGRNTAKDPMSSVSRSFYRETAIVIVIALFQKLNTSI